MEDSLSTQTLATTRVEVCCINKMLQENTVSLHMPVAVSYTHLDVYKRQSYDRNITPLLCEVILYSFSALPSF